MAKTKSKKDLYIKILTDYEKEKNEILKAYLARVKKAKSKGMKTLEKAMGSGDKAAAEKLLEQL
jgi:hypothetical protein